MAKGRKTKTALKKEIQLGTSRSGKNREASTEKEHKLVSASSELSGSENREELCANPVTKAEDALTGWRECGELLKSVSEVGQRRTEENKNDRQEDRTKVRRMRMTG